MNLKRPQLGPLSFVPGRKGRELRQQAPTRHSHYAHSHSLQLAHPRTRTACLRVYGCVYAGACVYVGCVSTCLVKSRRLRTRCRSSWPRAFFFTLGFKAGARYFDQVEPRCLRHKGSGVLLFSGEGACAGARNFDLVLSTW